MHKRTVFVSSCALAAFIVLTSCVGLFTPGFYSAESLNWHDQCTGQDLVDLFFIAPCLIIASILSYKKNGAASNIHAGILLYLIYTYTIYCFDIHFNRQFILYCITLGLSFYMFLYFLFVQIKMNPGIRQQPYNKRGSRFIAIYFISVSSLFYLLWISEIIPATIHNNLPASLVGTGLPANPVHVIDLSVFLPGVFITGILLLKKRPLGFLFAPVLLTFFILMDITIGALNIIMKINGLESSPVVTFTMILLALLSVLLLTWFFKKNNEPE